MIKTNNYSSDFGLNPNRVDIKLNKENGLNSVTLIIEAIKSGESLIETSLSNYSEAYNNELCSALNNIGITDIRYSGSYTLYKPKNNKDYNSMSEQEITRNLEFYAAYFECMFWADINCDTENFNDSLDYNSINKDDLISTLIDLDAFFKKADIILDKTDYDHDQACHDFYLTRCGHGCGFWENDHCNEDQGKILTDISESFGTVDISISENGETIYL